MPTETEFWDRIARRYAARPIRDEAAYRHTLERTRAYLTEASRVLELGCGTGSTALLLAPHAGHVTATDMAPEMIRIAQEKLEAEGLSNVTLRHAAADDPGFGRQDFDAVLAFNLLHLLPDLDGTLARIHEMLKPGGHFISKTVCLAEGGAHLRLFVRAVRVWIGLRHGTAPGFRFLRTGELEQAISARGFEIVETGTFPASPPSRFIVARKT